MTTETITQNTASENTDTAPEYVVPPVRLAVDKLVPHVAKAMNALEAATRKVSLEPVLLDLVRARASQLNGCVYCVDMHSTDLRKAGESERRIYALPVWREAPLYTARERAALELTEAVTRLSGGEVSDEVFERAAAQFSELELAELVWAIAVINTWNRLGAAGRPWPLD
jgi:AhpD family alkylhydroperoxidase